MKADEDDDALSWAGGSDATHVDTPVGANAARQPKPKRSDVGGPRATSATVVDDTPSTPASAAFLVTIGILAGIYLLYTFGWLITVQHTGTLAVTPLEQIAITLKEYLAIAACALWFAAVFYLTRHQRPAVRLTWLVIGAIVLIPWPFVLGIANVQ